MNSIKTEFTIRDLENFSGIKAHTIRIWEKRYGILEPLRTDSNIRYYTIDSLKKLLNVALLNDNGLKISKIADLSDTGIEAKVKELVLNKGKHSNALNSFKLAMLNFDELLFHQTYHSLLDYHTFREIFSEILMPFLNEIGVLWMVNSITPAHEHFISNLIKQKIYLNIDKVQLVEKANEDCVYVLFLPMNEIHELGLLYLHFELLLKGCHSIYLGQSVPMDNLIDLQSNYKKITFISQFTVEPHIDAIESYMIDFEKELLQNRDDIFMITGEQLKKIDVNLVYNTQIKKFNSLKILLKEI
ncbi:MAG: MerR family transcriptional regulator [Lutibacter sp.]|nr:MerR family transcriptional regulator [Lutibacter sp.]